MTIAEKQPSRRGSCCRPVVLLVLLVFLVSACSSPEEEARAFLQRGLTLLQEGNLIEANLELRNAIQLNDDLPEAWYALSLIEDQRANWPETYRLLQKVVERDPEHIDAVLRMGKLLLEAGELDQALEKTDHALDLSQDNPDALALHGAVLLRLEDPQGAIAQANKALQADPGHVGALTVLASERLAAEAYDEAIAYLNRGLIVDGTSVELQLAKLKVAEKQGDTKKIEAVLQELIAAYPENRAFRQTLVRFYLREHRPADAEVVVRAIAQQNPWDWSAQRDLVRVVGTIKGLGAAISELEDYVEARADVVPAQFALAELYLAREDADAAFQLYKTVVAKAGTDENGLKARTLMAGQMLGRDTEAALSLIEEVLQVDPKHVEARLLRSTVKLERHDIDGALVDLSDLLGEVPNSATAQLLMARAQELQGKLQIAEHHYERAFAASNKAAAFGLPYVRFLVQRDRAVRALRILEDILEREPRNILGLREQAQIRLAQADWVGAAETAKRIRDLGTHDAAADQIIGMALAGQQRYEEATEFFQKAHESSPYAAEPIVSLVEAYVRADQVKDARQFLDSVVKANPNNATAYALKAQLSLSEGDVAGSEDSLQAIVRHIPDDVLGYRRLAEFYAGDQRFDAAMEILDQGLKRLPDDFELLFTRAIISEQAGDYETAIADYQKLIEIQPKSDIVANNLAALLSQQRDDKQSLDRALTIAKRFENSQVPHYLDTLGWAYYRTGDHAKSHELLEEAARLAPEQPLFRYHYGMSLLAMTDNAAAKAEMQAVLDLVAQGHSFKSEEAARAIIENL